MQQRLPWRRNTTKDYINSCYLVRRAKGNYTAFSGVSIIDSVPLIAIDWGLSSLLPDGFDFAMAQEYLTLRRYPILKVGAKDFVKEEKILAWDNETVTVEVRSKDAKKYEQNFYYLVTFRNISPPDELESKKYEDINHLTIRCQCDLSFRSQTVTPGKIDPPSFRYPYIDGLVGPHSAPAWSVLANIGYEDYGLFQSDTTKDIAGQVMHRTLHMGKKMNETEMNTSILQNFMPRLFNQFEKRKALAKIRPYL